VRKAGHSVHDLSHGLLVDVGSSNHISNQNPDLLATGAIGRRILIDIPNFMRSGPLVVTTTIGDEIKFSPLSDRQPKAKRKVEEMAFRKNAKCKKKIAAY
jgi:hypothetical protein